ncbi:hypothetical protein LIPSTDRAFT_109054 [Lipomyces starkeyi NRRL Y-11557]|uniref:Uncharacterized protein n=1 Tax=Lipomyces starkeyi NRRL Y-11557 TaxID=675824 RepID=A0A1E3QCC5_LIPST|nr:hypothetical protein LIPSTDRAFT_109054 [Lipomyces starkeyi NRRL Y-11557]
MESQKQKEDKGTSFECHRILGDDFEDDVHVDEALSELMGIKEESLRIGEDYLITDDGFKWFTYADIREYLADSVEPDALSNMDKDQFRETCDKFPLSNFGNLFKRGDEKRFPRRVIMTAENKLLSLMGAVSDLRADFGGQVWIVISSNTSGLVIFVNGERIMASERKNFTLLGRRQSAKNSLDTVYLPEVDGYKYLVLARDDFSCWVEGRALRDLTSENVARLLLTMPIVDALAKAKGKWPDNLSFALWADQTTIRGTTGYSPYFLMYGQNGFLPIDYIFSTWPVEHIENTDNISTTELLCRRIDKLKQHLVDVGDARSKLKQSRKNSSKIWSDDIQEGDLVHLYDSAGGQGRRLCARWSGPYRVFEKKANGSYGLEEIDGAKFERSVAGNRLKLYHARKLASIEDDSLV